MSLRDDQQRLVQWGTSCFGAEHMTDPKVKALRLLEEAIELAQSVDVTPEKCTELVAYVYSRPKGSPSQELGGIGVTWLVAAAAMGWYATDALAAEIERISSKSPEHFAARNRQKCEAGFR